MASHIPFTVSVVQEGERSAAGQQLYVLGKSERHRGMSLVWISLFSLLSE